MARLKLQGSWEESKRLKTSERSFLADLVRAARQADRVIEEVDLYASFTEGSTSANTSNGEASSSQARRSAVPPSPPPARPSSTPAVVARPSRPNGPSGSRSARSAPLPGRPASAPVPGGASSAGSPKALRYGRRPLAGMMSTWPPSQAYSRSATPRSPDLAATGEILRGCSPSVARIPAPSPNVQKAAPDVPDWFRADGLLQPLHQPFLPEYSLWVTLHGGNGSWKRNEAKDEWARQVQDYEVSKREWALREERERARALEAEKRRKQEAEEEERRAAEADAERRRRRREEEDKRQLEADRRREKLEEEERQRRRRLARPCNLCEGSGNCIDCGGLGYTHTLYLASSVPEGAKIMFGSTRGANASQSSTCGRLPRGCETCGGWGDGAAWGEFTSGSGRCKGCGGRGKIEAPKGGWPS